MFGKVEVNKKATLEKVDYWDEIEGHRPLTTEEQEVRLQAETDYKRWSILEEASWRQV